jgi:glutamyl-tRNA synthetase
MLRFAVSSAGDMHIGDLRVALFNYLSAKKCGEDFVVRIKDLDQQNSDDRKNQEMLDILGLFGIEYSQILYQSQNFRFHSAMALQLLHEKKAFSCFCSDEWLQKKKQEAIAAHKPYRYDDACRNLPAELVIDNTAPFTVRITHPDKAITIHDKITGEIIVDSDDVDSFVIMNQDKTPTEIFACAIDDMLSDISMVVCLQDVSKTAKEIHVRNQLGYEKEIEYAHLPSFHHADISVKSLLEEGYLPEAISNYLISTANTLPEEIFTLQDVQEWFDFEMLPHSPASFDIKVLQKINQQHLKRMDATELSRYVGFADSEIGELARLYLDEVSTTRELKLKIAPIFEARDLTDENYLKVAEIIKSAPYFEEYDAFLEYVQEASDIKGEKLHEALRILLTNSSETPPLCEIYRYIKNYLGEIIK